MTINKDFLQEVFEIKDLDDLAIFFKEMFTPSELVDLDLRWKLLKDLHGGMTQRKIAEKYSISLCKITRGSKLLKNDNSVALKILKGQKEGQKKRSGNIEIR